MQLEGCVSCCLPGRILLELTLPKNSNLNKGIGDSSSYRQNLDLKSAQCSEEERQHTETAFGELGPQPTNIGSKMYLVGKQKLEFPCAAFPVLPDFPHILGVSFLDTKQSWLPVTVLNCIAWDSRGLVLVFGAGFGVWCWLPEVRWSIVFVRCHIRL